jgi:hypothetical protein
VFVSEQPVAECEQGALEEEIVTIAAIAMIAKIELHQANGTNV